MEKPKSKSSSRFPSELRMDIVSKDWVAIATGRAKRLEAFKEEKKEKTAKDEKNCPFCVLSCEVKNRPTYLSIKGEKQENLEKIPKNWTLAVIPNKYPAFIKGNDLNERAEGPYQLMDGIGFHEIVVTRDHKKDMSQFSKEEIKEVIDAYQERYLELMNEKFINYISIFHNHGREAGASIEHPHSQLMAIPVTDSDIQNSVSGSRRYWDFHKKCIHCEIIQWEKEAQKRLIFENEEFIALCPFASRMAFQVRIYPKNHLSYFERAHEKEKEALAQALQASLEKLRKALGSISYNFYLRTSPCDGKDYSHYHWHFEILPRTSVQAGFEFGVGIEISVIEPEKAAEYLRKQ